MPGMYTERICRDEAAADISSLKRFGIVTGA